MKIITIIILLILNSIPVFSCTTFVLENDSSLVFGRNLDWVSDNGVIVVNKRNIAKESLVFAPEKATEWTSKYGSVTFNQFGKEFPFGGINEKGLVVEIMVVAGKYPNFDNRTAINELQWVQYQLDNASTIEEVIASDKHIRISIIDQSLHFLVCDRLGNVAVIEFDENGIHVSKASDLPVPVLENETYAKSLQKSRNNKKCRFGTVSKMINSYDGKSDSAAINYSFDILNEVVLDGSWSIVYDIKNMEIHFKTSSHQTIRKIRVNDFNFSCDQNSLLYDLEKKGKGYINLNFMNFSTELNKKKFIDGTKTNEIRLPKEIFILFYEYYNKSYCIKGID